MEKRNLTISAIAAVLVLAADQLSKCWAETWLRANGEYRIWDGVLHLKYIENRGAAFGMLQGGKWFFLIVTAAACAAILCFLIKERKRLHFMMTFSLCLLLSGAVGNLIDRVMLGYVRDMIYVAAINFAVFNVADMAVTVGCGLLVIDMLFFKGKKYLDMLDKKPDAGEDGV